MEVIEAVVNSYSFSSTLDKLNISKVGSYNISLLKKYCSDNNISTSHFSRDLSRIEYEKNPKVCKFCGEVLPYEKRRNEFCNSSCSAKYGNHLRKRKKKIVPKTKKKKTINLTKKKKIKADSNIRRHNKLIDTKYKDFGLCHIDDFCCPICGQLNCTNQFCKNHNFSQLIGLVRLVGFNPKTIGTINVFDEFSRVKDYIKHLYWDLNYSALELCSILGANNHATILNILKYMGIPRRSLSESQKVSILKGNSGLFGEDKSSFSGFYHMTWEGSKVYLRSSYELDFAKDLDKNKIRYLVEYLRVEYYDSFLNKDRIAIPDFYFPDSNEIVEIKSDFTLDIQEMLDKFDTYKKLGYTPRLILEHKEIDLYNIENLVSSERLNKIKNRNIKFYKQLNDHI